MKLQGMAFHERAFKEADSISEVEKKKKTTDWARGLLPSIRSMLVHQETVLTLDF